MEKMHLFRVKNVCQKSTSLNCRIYGLFGHNYRVVALSNIVPNCISIHHTKFEIDRKKNSCQIKNLTSKSNLRKLFQDVVWYFLMSVHKV